MKLIPEEEEEEEERTVFAKIIDDRTDYEKTLQANITALDRLCNQKQTEIERLTRERDEWREKWIALARASLILSDDAPEQSMTLAERGDAADPEACKGHR